jgi:hypothetical protein
MFPIIMLIITILIILLHIALTRKTRNISNILEIILLDYFIIAVGIGQTMAGLEHIFNGPAIARGIGWAPGSPFQSEVGVANIAIGIAALLGIWFRGAYWLAVALIGGIFGVGAGIIHIIDIITSGNTAVYNAGPMLYLNDLALPILLIILVAVYLRVGKQSKVSRT